MNLNVKYQGRIAQAEEVEFIKELIKQNPNDSRREFQKKFVEHGIGSKLTEHCEICFVEDICFNLNQPDI